MAPRCKASRAALRAPSNVFSSFQSLGCFGPRLREASSRSSGADQAASIVGLRVLQQDLRQVTASPWPRGLQLLLETLQLPILGGLSEPIPYQDLTEVAGSMRKSLSLACSGPGRAGRVQDARHRVVVHQDLTKDTAPKRFKRLLAHPTSHLKLRALVVIQLGPDHGHILASHHRTSSRPRAP